MSLDFSILRKAGIPQELFAGFLKVSTPAVNKWVKGGRVHPAREKSVAKLLGVFWDAMERGELPVPSGTREEKQKAIKRILLTALRPPAQE